MKRTIESQWPNEGYIEFHENHFENSVPEHAEGETFYEWYTQKLLRFTTSGDHLKANILKQCYYKILHYQIDQSSCGYEMCDYQLILQCASLHQNYCRAYLLA